MRHSEEIPRRASIPSGVSCREADSKETEAIDGATEVKKAEKQTEEAHHVVFYKNLAVEKVTGANARCKAHQRNRWK